MHILFLIPKMEELVKTENDIAAGDNIETICRKIEDRWRGQRFFYLTVAECVAMAAAGIREGKWIDTWSEHGKAHAWQKDTA